MCHVRQCKTSQCIDTIVKDLAIHVRFNATNFYLLRIIRT